MFRELHYQYVKLLKSLTYIDILILLIVIIMANRWYSLVGLILLSIMQIFQILSTFKWKNILCFYSGWRRNILETSAMFCTAVAVKLYYMIAFLDVNLSNKTTLIFQIGFFFILIPNFTNWLIKSNTLKPI